MAAQVWDTTELLENIRQDGRLSPEDSDATDAKLLREADKQTLLVMVPMLRKARSEWYMDDFDQTLVSGQQKYRIPKGATASSIRTVVWVDSSGVEREIMPVPLTDRHLYQPATGVPYVYTIKDNEILLLPTPSGTLGTLRLVYERRPSTLATSDRCAYGPASAAGATTQVFVTTTGTNKPPSGAVDVILGESPFSAYMQSATAVLASVTYTITKPTGGRFVPTAVRAYICYEGETVIPQLPPEMHPLLSVITAAKYLRSIDPGASAALMADFDKAQQDIQSLITPRQVGRQQKIKSTGSMMRRGARRRGGFSNWTP